MAVERVLARRRTRIPARMRSLNPSNASPPRCSLSRGVRVPRERRVRDRRHEYWAALTVHAQMWSCVSRATTTATLRRQHGRLTFLNGLCQHAEELKARFDSVREQLVERMRTEDGRASLRWTLRSQLDEYDLWPEANDGHEYEVARYEDDMRRVDEEASETRRERHR